MEQNEALYEYKMGSEVYRFEAPSRAHAEKMRGSAIQYFAEKTLISHFAESALVGPDLVQMPSAFVFQSAGAAVNG